MRHVSLDQSTVTEVPAPNRPIPSDASFVGHGGTGVRWRDLARKQVIPLGMVVVMGWVFWDHAAALDLGAIHAAARDIAPANWALSLVFAAISFWAVGRYDAVLHAQLDTGISRRAARRTGIAAIGLSQFLGFGALTGSLIRWRLLPELTLWQSLRLSGAVALSFLAGWAIVAALAVLVLQPELPWMKTLATLAIALAGTMAALSVYPPAPLVRMPWPSLRTMATVVGLAGIDTIFAGATFFILLPPDVAVSIAQAISAYLFALGAGLIGSTPGGVGPFEATLANLLPAIPLEVLLGSVLAFRAVYYLLPAALSAVIVVLGPRKCNLATEPRLLRTSHSPFLPPELERQVFFAPRAEANLLRTRDFSVLRDDTDIAVALAAPIGQSLVMLSDPLARTGCPKAARDALTRTARDRFRMPAIYKCGQRMAASARRAGWAVIPTAEEAWITPETFSIDGSNRRQLRRVLRKVEEAQITTCEGGRVLPLDEMDRVAQAWKEARGGERGFSMGTYQRDYVTCQRVFLAYRDARLVAFVTFHETRAEMTLDLMRQTDEAPDGTIQQLIVDAIETAKAYGCPRVSLAAVPWAGPDANPLLARLRTKMLAKSGASGLRRFKSAFGPEWEVLYLAAPSRLALSVAAMDIMRRITAPPPKTAPNPMKANRFATHPVWHAFKRRARPPK
ncbi:phosphatidylglycerol lysyltransferase domain-containing protein [Celeribacter marinus]|uniref:phosphatidylglycerol lysyltransferase domain-containing protein n=1 Tax=Celeribacter marinus TaxID=1397108 RepID=UPI0031763D02